MRNGYLLAEENPIKLMEGYQLTSLEDVFLKLCIKQNNQVNQLALYSNIEITYYWMYYTIDHTMMKIYFKYRTGCVVVPQIGEQIRTGHWLGYIVLSFKMVWITWEAATTRLQNIKDDWSIQGWQQLWMTIVSSRYHMQDEKILINPRPCGWIGRKRQFTKDG